MRTRVDFDPSFDLLGAPGNESLADIARVRGDSVASCQSFDAVGVERYMLPGFDDQAEDRSGNRLSVRGIAVCDCRVEFAGAAIGVFDAEGQCGEKRACGCHSRVTACGEHDSCAFETVHSRFDAVVGCQSMCLFFPHVW